MKIGSVVIFSEDIYLPLSKEFSNCQIFYFRLYLPSIRKFAENSFMAT